MSGKSVSLNFVIRRAARRPLCWTDEVYVTVKLSAPTAARLDKLSVLLERPLGELVAESIAWNAVRLENFLGRDERLRLEAMLRRTLDGKDIDTILKLRDMQAFLA